MSLIVQYLYWRLKWEERLVWNGLEWKMRLKDGRKFALRWYYDFFDKYGIKEKNG